MDEPVERTRVDEAAETIEMVAAHLEALEKLGISEATIPAHLVTASWKLIGVATRLSSATRSDGTGESPRTTSDGKLAPSTHELLDQIQIRINESLLDSSKHVFRSYIDDAANKCSVRRPSPFMIDTNVFMQRWSEGARTNFLSGLAAHELANASRTPTVRDTVLDVIKPGEEVYVVDVHDRVTDRGLETSPSVISNELSRWSKTGHLFRVKRGVYARPEIPQIEGRNDLTADSPPEEEREGAADGRTATEGASTV